MSAAEPGRLIAVEHDAEAVENASATVGSLTMAGILGGGIRLVGARREGGFRYRGVIAESCEGRSRSRGPGSMLRYYVFCYN